MSMVQAMTAFLVVVTIITLEEKAVVPLVTIVATLLLLVFIEAGLLLTSKRYFALFDNETE